VPVPPIHQVEDITGVLVDRFELFSELLQFTEGILNYLMVMLNKDLLAD